MVAAPERQKFQNADAGRSRRTGLSRAGRRRAATFLDLTAQGRAVQTALLSRRGPLGSETAEQRALVQDRARLVRSVAEAERLDGFALSRQANITEAQAPSIFHMPYFIWHMKYGN